MNEKEIIYLDLNDDDYITGMSALSFVDRPATHIAWEKFNDAVNSESFEFTKNEMERVVTGPVMLAETPILRKSKVIGEYFVKFTEESIFKMMKKYFKENKIHNINEQHDKSRPVEGVIMIESFIVGDRVTSELYPNLPKGTWVASFYVQDETYWNETIMSDKFNGFSLEGHFIKKKEDEIIEQMYNDISSVLSEDISEDVLFNKIKKILKIQ